uniref:Uncharacterized protein n=1 Tax=Rangifer tarandus platyrhynchus TaxID=3082113 RepID=A0ACB0E139_RANTA|nr:unnamed protein product [Rangifer tarandus platyrhynchus]
MVPGRRNAEIFGPEVTEGWRRGARFQDGGGWVVDRKAEVKAPTKSNGPRIVPSPLLTAPGVQQKRECAGPFHSVTSPFPSLRRAARLPRERQAPQSRSSSPRLGSPRSRTRGSLWAALRSAVKRLSSAGSVSASS